MSMIGKILNKKVYMINGFLEAGKTDFIKYTLSQPYFRAKGSTLLLVCEEGEQEYDESLLRQYNVEMVMLEEEEDFQVDKLQELDSKYHPQRIIIEYNGMWNHKDIKLPSYWKMEQQITIIDASSFSLYYNNMKSIVGDMVRNSELILFNRADGVDELITFKRNVKMVNQQAEIIFEGVDSEITTVLDEELPYDITQEVIEITEDTYGVWFLDTLENVSRYEGKQVEFVAKVLKRDHFPKDYFVPARVVMTCCEDDLALLGFVCEYEGAEQLKADEWVKIKAVINEEYWADYGDDGPVLHALSVTKTEPPKIEILEFK